MAWPRSRRAAHFSDLIEMDSFIEYHNPLPYNHLLTTLSSPSKPAQSIPSSSSSPSFSKLTQAQGLSSKDQADDTHTHLIPSKITSLSSHPAARIIAQFEYHFPPKPNDSAVTHEKTQKKGGNLNNWEEELTRWDQNTNCPQNFPPILIKSKLLRRYLAPGCFIHISPEFKLKIIESWPQCNYAP